MSNDAKAHINNALHSHYTIQFVTVLQYCRWEPVLRMKMILQSSGYRSLEMLNYAYQTTGCNGPVDV
jgi:hypothetical protein